ncbi:hypothetical protein N656DRAFT_596975 [Canariomyces notabilis]|uniref:Secreted protein n=1 Tax=Canariomyces notabilis TaxID=2074819 RepID=A0AAN6YU98_9PEZI|nr:hypothetical protein N656DRAFT_596975 [Canariomyces arenarius]
MMSSAPTVALFWVVRPLLQALFENAVDHHHFSRFQASLCWPSFDPCISEFRLATELQYKYLSSIPTLGNCVEARQTNLSSPKPRVHLSRDSREVADDVGSDLKSLESPLVTATSGNRGRDAVCTCTVRLWRYHSVHIWGESHKWMITRLPRDCL